MSAQTLYLPLTTGEGKDDRPVIRLSPAPSEGVAPSPPDIGDFQDWQVVCATSDDRDCRMRPAPASAPGGFDVVLRHVDVPDQGPEIVVMIETEAAVLLVPGLVLQIDGKGARRLAFRSCHGVSVDAHRAIARCLAPALLTADLRRDLSRGVRMTLLARSPQGEEISQDVSLMGFTAALAALQSSRP